MKWCLLYLTGLWFATASSSYNYYRLPSALRPLKYDLRILTQLENPQDFHFSGTTKIQIEALENTNNITLHSKDLTIDEYQITLRQISGEEKKDNCVTSTEVNPTHDFYILNTCQELLAGHVYELNLHFSAKLNDQLEGYYRSSYFDSAANETRWISITHFEPASARLAFPCFDEPGYKAPFVITLGYHKKFTGLSNMPVKETKPHESIPDYLWTEFQESLPISTYLVAYSVNDFSHKPSTLPNGALFRTWARPNAINQCDYASEFGPKVLNYYEELFGIKFPLPKVDQFAVPDFNIGAMENWGLVTYRETALLYSSEFSSLKDKQELSNTIAHELAHQWFGNLVTMKWWTDLWLKEGVATYVATLCVEYIHPEWRSMELESLSNLLAIFRKDSLESSHPISRPIEMVSQISESFDEISYEKGSSVLRMMHLFLGEESFRTGLKSYLERYAYKNAEQDNLWESLTQAAHKTGSLPKDYDIKTIMDSWTLQTGYPLVNVTRDYTTKTAKLSQERYLLNTDKSRAGSGCWWVPLSYTTQEEKDFNNTAPKAWMECSKTGESQTKTIQDLPGPDQWVIFNNLLSSPYKVNYDAQNWKLLIETLNSDQFQSIPVINRAQLIDDVLYFGWTGEQDYEITLQLINYLHRERELLPWKSAFENLKLLNRIVRQTPNFQFFRSYVKQLITPIYEHVKGINDTFSSIQQQDQILLKSMVVDWACQYQVADCVPQALAYYHNWRSEANPDGKNTVPINVRHTVYCTLIRLGSDEDWEFLWTRYKNSNVAAEKRTILTALGCSKEVWLLQRYLELIFDPKEEIRKQDSKWAFQAVAKTDIGFLLAKKYFMDNVEFINNFYHQLTRSLTRLLEPLEKQVFNRKDYNEFKEFVINSERSFKGSEEAIQWTLEVMLTNVQWKERNYDQFTRAIKQLL
ncbi:aminopeptidase N-like [Drosophila subpulchrella]|uniref:aminopeptidase N-like n=1 Tax=Drosophila subpulchrella TaxID=1486046 RepID=UPI0018A12A53|nr:aminopeptidase N-like [Drosophila subpulchrella]XP_037727931.1 aminopeptidase N-like [Drosophila subpulchrella]